MQETLRKFFRKYIDGTLAKAIVVNKKMFLCNLTNAVIRGINIDNNLKGVYINSRCLKHLYDKKPAEEFIFILDNLHKVVKYPDKVFKNIDSKRGEFCLVKKLGDSKYFCSIEIIRISTQTNLDTTLLETMYLDDDLISLEEIQVVTAFRLRNNKYLKNYTLLWDWEDDNPHRSALDAPEESTNAPQ